MDYADQAEMYHVIVKTLRELGIPNAGFSITDTTVLVRDGCYIGRCVVCGNVRVLLPSGGRRIEFHDASGGILRVIGLRQSVVGQARAA